MKAKLKFLNGSTQIIPIPEKKAEGKIFYPESISMDNQLFLFTHSTEDGCVVYKEQEMSEKKKEKLRPLILPGNNTFH